ncbi:hypothetical protein K466DRAFT_591535 [Polyporus arcularius HHB13444]|uniref:Uncharacterized protein n=1 Tax=Polyporus arcularius HHB13444 TaxID=1314778 RepID=A0A5C3NVC9_9APHY|nr:hypothetical protein K466DRAFT_591535 [Polyporus arcularius HHB13444]
MDCEPKSGRPRHPARPMKVGVVSDGEGALSGPPRPSERHARRECIASWIEIASHDS